MLMGILKFINGSGTMFFDIAQYAAPRGDYQVFEDARGGQWYAVRGEASVVFIMTTAKRLSFLK